MTNTQKLLIKYLQTDYSYQSPVIESQVKNIMKNFDSKSLHSIVVSEREDGSYFIIDGQHRVVALMRMGFTSIEATVHKGLTPVEEAEMYRNINERKMKSKNAFAKADLKSGVKYAVEIDEVVNRAGLIVDYEKSQRTFKHIKAYDALKAVYQKYGKEHLYKTLITATHIFGGTHKEIQAWTIRGLAEFLDVFDEMDEKRLKKSMASITFEEFKRKNNQKKLETGNTAQKSLPFTLVDIYNRQLTKDKRLNALKLLI